MAPRLPAASLSMPPLTAPRLLLTCCGDRRSITLPKIALAQKGGGDRLSRQHDIGPAIGRLLAEGCLGANGSAPRFEVQSLGYFVSATHAARPPDFRLAIDKRLAQVLKSGVI